MKFNVKRILKGSLISLAVLGMIGGSLNIPNVSARRRYRTHRVYRHRARRPIYRFGYWRHYRFYRYKTGYFRNGRWIRTARKRSHRYYVRHTRRTHRRRTRTHYTRSRRMNHRVRHVRRPRRTSHRAYRWMGHTYYSKRAYNRALYNSVVFGNPNGPVKKHKQVRRVRRHPARHTAHHSVAKVHTQTTQGTSTNNSNNYYGGSNSNASSQDNNDDNYNPDNPNTVATNLREMKQQTLTDINNDRQANGVSPLIESNELDNIANMRANQIYTNYEHKDPNTGVNYYAEDASKLGYSNVPDKTLGENIDNNLVSNSDKENGNYMANTAENNMVNHDAHSDWGHRYNILTSNDNHIGIGVAYSGDGCYDLAEDFEYY